MDPYTLPENFADLGRAELAALDGQIVGLAGEVEHTVDNLDYLESLQAARAAVAGRDAELAAAERLAAASDALAAPAVELADDTDDTDEDDDDEAELAADDVAELAADTTVDGDDTDPEAADADGDNIEGDPVTASGKTVVRVGDNRSLRRMQESLRPEQQPRPSTDAARVGFVATGADGANPVELSIEQLAERICEVRHAFTNHDGPFQKIKLATAKRTAGQAFARSAEASDAVVRELAKERNARIRAVAASGKADAGLIASGRVANGGPCAPLQPMYAIFDESSVQAPLDSFFDRVDADRGGVRFTPPPDFATAMAGGGADDQAVVVGAADGSTTKTYAAIVSCPSETEVIVRPVSRRVRFDNLNYRVNPEQVAYYLNKLALLEAQEVEEHLIDTIDTNMSNSGVATSATAEFGAVMGSSRGVLGLLEILAHRYRKAQYLSLDAPLDVVIPDTAITSIKVDMIRDWQLGGNFLYAPLIDVKLEIVRRMGLNLALNYFDSTRTAAPATGSSYPASAHRGAQTAFAMPTTARLYMMTAGSVVIPDAGSLDLGVVRDSALNDTNDLELFSERWLTAAHVGDPIDGYDFALKDDGLPSTIIEDDITP